MTDYEIAKSAKLKDIRKVGKSLGCKKSALICYGKNMAKVESITNNPNSKLILVTAINPTPAGEGKTTVAIGLADALKLQKKKVCLALREPSLGPVFGMKGGACGGGQSQVVPMEEINLHFTGDFHAVTSANNLLCALVDNHIFQGNSLGIKEVTIKRCLDVNDRALREITISQEKLKNNIPRQDGFVITSACEIMAILCFSRNMHELKARLGNIIERQTYLCQGFRGRTSHGYYFKRSVKAKLSAIAYGYTSLGALRTFCKYSSWLQFFSCHPNSLKSCGLCRYRGGLWKRSWRRKIFRYQV